MNHVISYNKTLQERLQEYTDILGGYESLDVWQISREWTFFLDITIDHNGWQAIWKIPRLVCQKLNIEFPTLALVYVENVYVNKLSAKVSILKVHNEADLAKKHVVPIIQLWPTEKQDETIGLNLLLTANAIDILRFFYTNLLMPWDDEDTSPNWLNRHLESRLHLFYDLRNGTISKVMAEHIRGVLTEARHIEELRQQLMEVIDIEEDINPDPKKQTLAVQQFLDIRIRMMKMQNELELIENPLLRKFVFSEIDQKQVQKESQQLTYWVVFEQEHIEDVLLFLQRLQSDVGDAKVTFQPTFATALEQAQVKDKIFLCDSKHVFNNLCNLQEGGCIKGINCTSKIILSSTTEYIVLDCRGEVVLENLYIDIGMAQCGILVRSGVVYLKNCTVVGNYKSSIQQGVIVLAGGEMHIDNCTFKGFFNAIVVNSGGTLSLKNTIILDVNLGLKFYDKSKVTVRCSTFKNNTKYGIFVETDELHVNEVGDFDILLSIEEIKVENVTGENNGKGNVKINNKCQLEPICDLFSNPQLDPTIIHDDEENDDDDDDDDMEVSGSNSMLDDTAIEIKVTS